jgi:hypothetical protein
MGVAFRLSSDKPPMLNQTETYVHLALAAAANGCPTLIVPYSGVVIVGHPIPPVFRPKIEGYIMYPRRTVNILNHRKL